jgi:hypothetical protein
MSKVIDLRSRMATCPHCPRLFHTDRGAMTHVHRVHKAEHAALLADIKASVDAAVKRRGDAS